MFPTVTLLYGSISAILVGVLGANLSLVRLKKGLYIGKEVDKHVHRMVRAHGNAAEWVPLLIVLLLLLELSGLKSPVLHALGGAIVAARLVHAAGVYAKVPRLSMLGATLTYCLVIGMSAQALLMHFRK
jgi:uncharacterized membrane protein YecN with MAPEG domain